ncbi:Holliday junction branch migration protein RuvA [Allostreptomyces psammosilenae]|uniref:Holliday junction branch migration complex subunit RuvA n=1 Tax=Allostreptomyces psammosilenae TaxID=1892865 RepID=A0A852ZW80_9ACTN|nr:Holliday junction branch migration protein RuvA [Allostreptomyces psammosilenae]NYI05024.1 Holliday junction DNA helicase RuvA [Allostreptomyces psammosilenae]
MIASITGRVTALTPDAAVLETGGVGLLVHCTPTTLADLTVGEERRLATSLVVREDALTLYGFLDDDERLTFELLQTAGGVGPRLAQAMLAVHSPDGLRRAFASGDEKALTAVPGIGKKGAQRLLLELKDRLGAPRGTAAPERAAAGPDAWADQLHAALVGLGYQPREAEEAVRAVTPEAEAATAEGRSPQLATLLRSALRGLNRTR